MVDPTLSLYRELTEACGVPGQEGDVREVVRRYVQGLATLDGDRLGSLVARKVGTAERPCVMVAAHLDEVGFLVARIEDDGFLRFQNLGGWWDQVLPAQRVLVRTRRGDLVGVIGVKPPHVLPPEARKKPVERSEMFIDIGVASRAEAEAAGVRPGDPIVPICPFTPLANPKYLMAKAWDNRAGCAVVIDVLRRLQGQPHPNLVCGVWTVQEETGLSGAATSAHRVRPDVAMVVDVAVAGDTPGMKASEATAKLGGGPVVLLYDATLVPNRHLRDLVVETAEAEGIPVQYDLMPRGGTDGGRIHLAGDGVPTLVLGVPARYIHSHAAVVHRDDLEAAGRLVAAVVGRLDAAAVEGLYR
ncbi:MAG: M42 family metallopeptidase [Clostridia bacterium]|nr:M42 family metallopeptidase [Clostridia bacterium]